MSLLPKLPGEVHYSPRHGYVLVNSHVSVNHYYVEALNNRRTEVLYDTDIEWKNQHTQLPDWVHAELMRRALQGGLT